MAQAAMVLDGVAATMTVAAAAAGVLLTAVSPGAVVALMMMMMMMLLAAAAVVVVAAVVPAVKWHQLASPPPWPLLPAVLLEAANQMAELLQKHLAAPRLRCLAGALEATE
jgi:hypothetical protein